MINNYLRNWTQIKHFRHYSIKFLVNIILGLIVCSLIALYAVPSGSPVKPYKTSWIGNTFGGGSKWVQNFVDGMYVASDGTVFTNSTWDEGSREAGIYKNGDVIGKAEAMHGWGRNGGVAVTANSKYLYVSMKQEPGGLAGEDYPPQGTNWLAVRRYNLSGEPAPFTGGRGYDKSMLIISTSGQVTGLATGGSELYVSDSTTNRIRVFNSDTMTELRSWSFARPRQIVVDRAGNLWIIQAKAAGNPAKILHYSKAGKLLPQKITNVVDPTALAVSNQGRLLVAENDSRQQVLIYNITGQPKLIGTFGAQGGVYSGRRGEVGSLKFYGITGVGTDSAGNIYVSSNGFNGSGTDLRKFSPAGAMQWRLLGLKFVDSADADPGTDAVDVFAKDEHFVMDYSKGIGKEWTYKGYTLDRFRYPDDPRLQNLGHGTASAFVRRINGKRFLYLTGQWPDMVSIYRFDGEIAVPSGIFAKKHQSWPPNQPTDARWMWRDRNGDGSIQSNEYENLGAADDSIWAWDIDSKGDIWQASEASGIIRHYPVQGLDAYGSPIYTRAASREIPKPTPFQTPARLKYFPATDVMYVSGYTSEHPKTGNEWGIVGTEIVRYDNWSTKRKVRWRITLPYDPKADPFVLIKAMDVAGERVFAVDSRMAIVYVYDAATGSLVTKLTPGPEVGGESGWIDIPYGLRAYRRKNGEYLVFVEEDWKAKVIMYRLTR